MFKSAFIGFLVGAALVSFAWFFIGRPDIKRVRTDLNEVHGAYEQIQRDFSQLSTDVAGVTDYITEINTESGTATDRVDSIAGKLESNTEELRFVLGKVGELEHLNVELIRLGRDFGDNAFDLRRLSESYGAE